MDRRRRRQFDRPQISALESRQLLSSSAPAPFINTNGVLVVAGTVGNDTCSLTDAKKYGQASVKVVIDGSTYYFGKAGITSGKIHFVGLAGNDYCIDSVLNLQFLANGGDGNDKLVGSNGNDIILGEDGNDTITGNDGNDQLYGDDLTQSSLDGHNAPDRGSDVLYGGRGNDLLSGGDLGDFLYGGDDNDSLYGGDGKDLLDTGDGRNYAWAGWNNDTLKGGSGIDDLLGEENDDVLYGGASFDFLYGGDGNDFLDGQADDAQYDGGRGIDCAANQPVINGVSYSDIFQQGSSSCWFLATLGAMTTLGKTSNGQNVDSYLSYAGNGVYNVKLYNGKTRKWVNESVNFTGATSVNNGDATIVNNGDQFANAQACEGEFWATVIHWGMLKYYKIDYTNASAITNADYGFGPGQGGHSDIALTLLGNTTSQYTTQSDQAFDLTFISRLKTQLNRNGILQPVIAGSKASGVSPKIVTKHAYQILAIDDFGYVTLRNPWGTDGGTGGDSVNDGIVVVSPSEFQASFGEVDYTKSPVV